MDLIWRKLGFGVKRWLLWPIIETLDEKGVDISRGSTHLLVNKHSQESFYPGKKRLGSTYLLVNKYWGVLLRGVNIYGGIGTIFNKLLTNIRSVETLSVFIIKVKNYFLDQVLAKKL